MLYSHKNTYLKYCYVLFSLLLISSCSKDITTHKSFTCDSEAAYANCLTPKFSPEYYIDQGVKYFLTMESTVPANVQPNYSDLVVRWEWPPWLLLTGYTRDGLIVSDIVLKLNPTAYDTIDCQFFDQQPFCRCHVIFDYSGEKCPIYEEFTFNDQGEITFIEAWSDYPSLIPMQTTDYWAESPTVYRLSAVVPGLGNKTGKINPNVAWMLKAAEADTNLSDLIHRINDPIKTWFDQLIEHQEELSHGCEKPEGDIFPYK
ncbi:MAG: hypothetical protein H6553_03355 [Chitinophagales bacterium]|nr:hypothetical protein [Chitinophagales bacterium]